MPEREIRVMLKAALIAVALFLFAGLASAQVPSGNIFFGYSYENTDWSGFSTVAGRPNLHGWEASSKERCSLGSVLSAMSPDTTARKTLSNPLPNGPITISVTGHEQEYLFGPRLSIPVGKWTPFGEVMVGFAHIHTGGTLPSPSNTSFATAVGGGIDYRVFRPIALRAEGDYIRTSFFDTSQNNLRLSLGLVLRF